MNAKREIGLTIATALVACALPAAASATDYCVAPNTTCGGTNVTKLGQALDQADNTTSPDRVFLGAAEYTAGSGNGFVYDRSDAPVEIIGAGIGRTVLTGPTTYNASVLRLTGGAGSSVHDLTIRLRKNALNGYAGLVTDDTARRVEVVEDPTQANPRFGVLLMSGGTLEDSRVTIKDIGVWLRGGGGMVRRSAVSAQTAVSSTGGTIERVRVVASNIGVYTSGGVTTVEDSLVRLTGSGMGIHAGVRPGVDTTVNADGVTLVGPTNLVNSIAIGVTASTWYDPLRNADVRLTNSIIRGMQRPLEAEASGPGHATVAISHSDYDRSGNFSSGGRAHIAETAVSNVGDARFVDAAAGDYRLLPNSPLVDAGDPDTAQGLDLDGNPLVADGDGDGTARRDMGAFELQPSAAPGQPEGQPERPPAGSPAADAAAPLISGLRAKRMAHGARFRYTLSEAARVTLEIKRKRPGRTARYRTVRTLKRLGVPGQNRIRFTGKSAARTLRTGRYRIVMTATDAAGNRSAPRATRFRVAR